MSGLILLIMIAMKYLPAQGVLEINVNHSPHFPCSIAIEKNDSETITNGGGGGYLDYNSFRDAETQNFTKDKVS